MLKSAVFACLAISTAAYADDAATAASPIVIAPGSTPVLIEPSSVAPLSVAPPLAPPQVDPVAVPPPQNEPWSNVSHINGVPVPVGERNRYLYSYKKTNLQVNPFGPLVGYYSIAASHAISSNVAVSVELSLVHPPDGSTTSTQGAVSVPIYFKRVFSGPFLEPGLLVRNDGDDGDDEYGDGANSTYTAIEMMFGWAWMFDSGLNVAAAIGVSRQIGNNDDCCDDDIEPAGYFRVGYAF
ncbi:MAG TPA: hypothetical protein VGG74_19910 [Kofleriaceae bacterium]|jgi:hypothetical protein